MEGMSTSVAGSDEFYQRNIQRTLEELQQAIEQHQSELSEIEGDPERFPFADPSQSALASIDVMTSAYGSIAQTEPFLPSSGSVLPALLALRKTRLLITDSRAHLRSLDSPLDEARRNLRQEEDNLRQQKETREALKKRIQDLRSGLETRMEMTPEQLVQQRLQELKAKKIKYDRDTSKLMKALNNFINDDLDTMLAVEELGGPIVGGLMDIDADDLEAGFNARRKSKKDKGEAAADPRQRRIDDMLRGNEEPEEEARATERQGNKALAAGAEMRELTEQLLNSLIESGGDSSAAYVKIPRESAAARFLVRSKVAQFHPKDATKLRLIDFGRELDN